MTRAQLATRVRRAMRWDANDSEAMQRIYDKLDDALNLVTAERAGKWKLLRAEDSSSVTSSTTTIDVPTTWNTLELVYLVDSNGNVGVLDRITDDEQRRRWSDPANASRDTPTRYLIISAADGSAGARKYQIILAPYSNTSYTLYMVGFVRPDTMDAPTDEPWFDERFHVMLAEFAQAWLMDEDENYDERAVRRVLGRAERRLGQMKALEPDGVTPGTSVPFME